MSIRKPPGQRLWLAVLLLPLLVGCPPREAEPVLPTAEEAAARYGAEVAGEVRGNLVEIRVPMADHFLRRGGVLWARGGPYFYLFSSATRDLFAEYPDLAAVRVVIHTETGEEIARAELHRHAFTPSQWRQALGLSAIAQRDGTESPRRIEELIHWGEDNTEFQYNPEFTER